uniref:Uncharacterized protein n=1 Tax=Oryza glumipatula TaxID=40148 RepID=A0A0D9ZZR8_9ORYZ
MSSLFFLSRCPRWRGLEDDQVWCRRAVEPAAPARWHMPEASLTVTSLLVMLLSVNHDLDSINTDQTAV